MEKTEAEKKIEQRIKEIIIDQLDGVKEEDVVDDASFADDLGADSLDAVELIMAVEEEYGLNIPDEEAEGITTVKILVDYVLDHKK